MAGIYDNPAINYSPAGVTGASPALAAQVRLGHSRSILADNPSFSAVPNNIETWSKIAVHIMDRYINIKKYPIRDWTVWNEPDGGYVCTNIKCTTLHPPQKKENN